MAYLELQFSSTTLSKFTTIKAYLPSDAMSGTVFEPPYKTLYFLPGFSNDATALTSYLGLRRECELKGIAIVVFDGDNAFYVDHPERHANYSSFVKEVVDVTRKFLPLSTKKEDTYIGGISMGGYGALYNGLRYKDIFSKIVALSPSVDCYNLICEHEILFNNGLFQNIFSSEEEYYQSNHNLYRFYSEAELDSIPELFIACGEQDDLVLKGVNDLREVFANRNIPFTDIRGEGSHEMAYWEERLDQAFSFLANIPPKTNHRLVLRFD